MTPPTPSSRSSTGLQVDMSMPAGVPSPHSLTGPSRTRSEARQIRTSLGKPYNRPSLGTTSNGRPGQQQHLHLQKQQQQQRRGSDKEAAAHHLPSSGTASSSSTTPTGGLLSGLRQAIFSRPLSWLQRGAPRSEGLPESKSSSSSLTASPGVRSAAQKLANSLPPQHSHLSTSSSMREVHPLAVNSSSVSTKTPAFVAPQPSTPSRSAFASTLVLPLRDNQVDSVRRTPVSYPQQSVRSPSPTRSSASAIVRSHGRQRLSVGPSTPRTIGGSGASLIGTPGYQRAASQLGEGSVGGLSHANSSASFAYGFGSERRLGGLGSSASMHGSASGGIFQSPLASTSSYGRLPSRSPFSVQPRGVGSSRRSGGVAGSNGSASEMATGAGRVPNYPSSRTSYGMGLVTTPSRPVSLFGSGHEEGLHSRAHSMAGSRTSSRNNTPKRRGWSSLNLAPPSTHQTEGEQLMHEYALLRDASNATDAVSSIVHPALNDGDLTTANDSIHTGSLKRDAAMSVDEDHRTDRGYPDDISMSGSQPHRKRQMVWDADLGFVTRQEQRAHRVPPRPVANNEAERLLNVLEGMRTPLGDARRDASARSTTPSLRMLSVPVPLPVSSIDNGVRSDGISGSTYNSRAANKIKGGGEYSKAVSPHARALRRSKLSQTEEAEQQLSGLRSRLRRPASSTRSGLAHSQQSDDKMSVESDEETGEGEDDESEVGASISEHGEEDDDDDVVEPPRKRTGTSLLRSSVWNERGIAATAAAADAAPSEDPKVLRSGKVVASAASAPNKRILDDTSKSQSKPMSRARISTPVNGVYAASKQHAERAPLFSDHKDGSSAVASLPAPPPPPAATKDSFTVLSSSGSSSADSQQRNRSSLRQGAQKTSRMHVRSGRIGLDDEADDDKSMDDLPSADELSKIKLPVNLFPKDFRFSSGNARATDMDASISLGSQPKVSDQTSQSLHTEPQQPSDDDTHEEKTQAGQGASLLSRMGGFASSQPSQISSDTKSAPTGQLFSFGPPTGDTSSHSSSQPTNTSSRPQFSFQPSISSPLATPSSSVISSKSADLTTPVTPSSSSFFAAPSEQAKKATVPATATSGASVSPVKKEGPVPNFFASSLAKSSQASESGKPTFSFGQTSSGSGSDTAPSVSLFDGKTSSAAGAVSEKKEDTVPNFFATSLAKPAQPSESAKPTFSFGQTSSGSDGQGSPATSLPFGGHSNSTTVFGVPQPQKPSTASPFGSHDNSRQGSPSPFTFGTPSGGSAPSSQAQTINTFAGFGSAPVSSPSASAPAPAFKFDSPAQAKAQPSSVAPVGVASGGSSSQPFSFSMPSSGAGLGTGTTPQLFGAPSEQAKAAAPATTTSSDTEKKEEPAPSFFATSFAKPAQAVEPGKPTFAFGQTSSGGSRSESAPPSSPFGTTSFGTHAPANPFGSNDTSRQGSPAPFAFGAPASSGPSAPTSHAQSSSAFGAGFGSTASSSAPGPAFSFGTPAQPQPQPQQPSTPTNNSPFSFSVPNFGAGPGTTTPGAGQTHSGTGTPPPFVFGGGGIGAAPTSNGGNGTFAFGAGMTPQQSQPTQPIANVGGATLFSIGGPSSSSSTGNRPMRSMPSRRKKA